MKQTVVGVFESPLVANEAVHVLRQARFEAERIPRIMQAAPARPLPRRLLDAMAQGLRDFMEADRTLRPYARALAKGRFVVRVHADHSLEAVAARRILETAGGKEIDVLADEWVEG
jgi:hypothetical protein